MNQEILKEWFNLASEHGVHYVDHSLNFAMYKGFKISFDASEQYHIQDVRKSNWYTKVTKSDSALIQKHGFIKGVDILSNRSDRRRFYKAKKKIEKLYDAKKITKDVNTIKSIDRMIDINISRFFYYRYKIEQHENKYK